MDVMENGKKFEREKRRLTGEYEQSAIKRRVEDAAENVARLESIGLSRRIAIIVSARQYGVEQKVLNEFYSTGLLESLNDERTILF